MYLHTGKYIVKGSLQLVYSCNIQYHSLDIKKNIQPNHLKCESNTTYDSIPSK